MKKLTLTLFSFFSFVVLQSFVIKPTNISDQSLAAIVGLNFKGDAAKDLINDYLQVINEDNVDYIFNPQNKELVLYLKNGLNNVEVKDFTITSHITNINFEVNNSILLHVSYYNNSDEILLIRAKQYDEFFGEEVRVITEI
ncbi:MULTISPECIES: hypothetical protein [Flammeovirga]|uniref:DUF4783 domain-containing protein n=1 Tax=Flammeovirga agarivorans TaxID=2726742 RepID=A0A7X8SKW2_9BACT|nr:MULTISPECIES: hypothetical protein [Flammeovirga]NLR92126.1 hypothetical protein [Flammeovirga agarivorans]